MHANYTKQFLIVFIEYPNKGFSYKNLIFLSQRNSSKKLSWKNSSWATRFIGFKICKRLKVKVLSPDMILVTPFFLFLNYPRLK